jgi:hypothetical protein
MKVKLQVCCETGKSAIADFLDKKTTPHNSSDT